MTFEELQKSWQTQPVAAAEDSTVMYERFASKMRKQQRSALLTAIGITVAFWCTLSVFAWVYIKFHKGHSLFFSGSIISMAALLLVYLGVIWRGISFNKIDPTLPGNLYLDHHLAKLLWRRKTITTYTWIYAILLAFGLMCYMYDVLRTASIALKIGAPLATLVYIFGMQILKGRTSQKKQLAKIDELIADLEALKTAQ
jgi:hypothetical protein